MCNTDRLPVFTFVILFIYTEATQKVLQAYELETNSLKTCFMIFLVNICINQPVLSDQTIPFLQDLHSVVLNLFGLLQQQKILYNLSCF